MPITATTRPRADTILSYINGITLSGRTLTYPSSSSSSIAEERAVQWLVEDDLGTAVDDEPSLRQRYVLGTLWFLQMTPTTTGLGSAAYATTWATNIDECNWLNVECDGNGHVTALKLWSENVRSIIPHDLGLLTDLTYLSLWGNQLFGTIPLSLGALTALLFVDLEDNQLSGTIPSSLGALTALALLDLEDNQLSGTIPSSLGALTALNELYLSNNQLVGTMPFCNSVQSFRYLVADCAKVNCTCCTACCPVAFGNIRVYDYCDN
jgi:Leucine-rich repeat (LRR) protein